MSKNLTLLLPAGLLGLSNSNQMHTDLICMATRFCPDLSSFAISR